MQITASAAISTISARMSCVIRSGICVRLSPTNGTSFPSKQSSNPRQSQAGVDRNLGGCSIYPHETKTMNENNQVKMPASLFGKKGSRRDFLRNTAVTALAGTALAACPTDKSGAQTPGANSADHSGGTTEPNPAPASAAAAAEAMDKMHEAGIKAFPAKTAGKGNQLMQPRMDKGVKVYELTAKKLRWETAPRQTVEG